MATKGDTKPVKAKKPAPKKAAAPKKPKQPAGRPSTYAAATGEAICARLAEGEPLRQICRDDNMPAWRTVYLWMEQHADFAARIAHAREIGADAIAQECLHIADTPLEGVRIEVGKDGTKTVTEDMLGHRKLQIETRLKLLAKWNPKKYGDKVTQEVTGPNGGPQQLEHKVTLSAEEAYRQMIDKA